MENIQEPQVQQPEEPAMYQPLNNPKPEHIDDDPNETFLAHTRPSFFDSAED